MLGAGGLNAFAEVWSYVDEQGVVHFASSQLDAKYALFFKGNFKLDAPEVPKSSPVPDNTPLYDLPEVSASMAKRIAYLEFAPAAQVARLHMRDAAQAMQVDYGLLQALISTESGFDPNAVSPKGAVGLMQVMPATALRYGVREDKHATVEQKLMDPRTNIFAGTRYLRDLIEMFPGQLELAIAAYNAGEGAVKKAGNKIPNFKETQNYVKNVMELYAGLSPLAVRVNAVASDSALASTADLPGPATPRMQAELNGTTGRSNMPAPLNLQAFTMTRD